MNYVDEDDDDDDVYDETGSKRRSFVLKALSVLRSSRRRSASGGALGLSCENSVLSTEGVSTVSYECGAINGGGGAPNSVDGSLNRVGGAQNSVEGAFNRGTTISGVTAVGTMSRLHVGGEREETKNKRTKSNYELLTEPRGIRYSD